MTALETLEKYWGYTAFRPLQEEIVRSALEGRDTLALLPTGGGKSVCFQVPAMMRDGIALVVTPLIALMKDQVQNLEMRGIKALSIHAGMTRREVELTLNNALYGDYKFLYLSPERLSTRLFLEYVDELPVNFIVIDEAHCISQWGYDFRPEYLRIGELRRRVEAPVIALTATATPQVARDIMEKLGFSDANLLRAPFERPNLTYVVRRVEDKLGQLSGICRGVGGSGIVYMRHRSRCEEIASFLVSQGISASFYHAGLSGEQRTRRQEDWKSGRIPVMVCTNAFGMGIDKSDVRFVVHMDMPDSPEAYFQEAGRAGRDGERSYAVLLWNGTDELRLKRIEQTSFPSLEYIEDIYQKLHIFHEVPYDRGEWHEIKFSLENFSAHYSLSRQSVHYALKYLEKTDHITYSEDVDIPTRVKIVVDRHALYDMDFPDSRMESVLEALMRTYTGIFSFLQKIDEEYIASRCDVNVPQLRQLLYQLSLEHVISYVPCDRSSVVVLHHDRLRPGNLALKPLEYKRLREAFAARVEAMLDYASQSSQCRSGYLVRYFGQSDSPDCGVCDVCRSKGAVAGQPPAVNDVKDFWIRTLGGGPYTVARLQSVAADPTLGLPPDAIQVLRILVDDGILPPPTDDGV